MALKVHDIDTSERPLKDTLAEDDGRRAELLVPPPPPKRRREYHETHRMTMVDIEEIGLWLIGRLREKYPQHNAHQLKTWLRGCTEWNECLFIRASGAVAMATVNRAFLRRPWVEEVFCFCMTDDDKVWAAALYTDIRRWAIGQGAEMIEVKRFTDVSDKRIVDEIGEIERVSRWHVRLLPE